MKILMVTDGTPRALTALSFGAQIAQRASEPPTILAIIDPSRRSVSSQPESILAQAVDLVDTPDVRTQFVTGYAFDQILHEIEQGGYDLVIMADRWPRRILQRFLWRSTAIRVAECAPCSVLIVRGNAGRIKRILLCESGVNGSSLLSRLVIQLANLLDGEEEVTILHVMSQVSAGPGVSGKHLRAGAKELIEEHTPEGLILEQDMRMLEKPGIKPTPKVRHGLVVDEILSEARSGGYDLVVVGAHPAVGERRFLLDNIGHQVLKSIDRPILVVRKRENFTHPSE
jgi:nucleotide-binding universal stress UspA family protein